MNHAITFHDILLILAVLSIFIPLWVFVTVLGAGMSDGQYEGPGQFTFFGSWLIPIGLFVAWWFT